MGALKGYIRLGAGGYLWDVDHSDKEEEATVGSLTLVYAIADDRGEHIDRRADPVQSAKDVERVMLETREWPGRKQEIDRDAIRHRIAARHCRMLAKGFARGSMVSRTARPQAEPRFRAHAPVPHAGLYAHTRAMEFCPSARWAGWTAQRRAQVTVQLALRNSAGQPC